MLTINVDAAKRKKKKRKIFGLAEIAAAVTRLGTLRRRRHPVHAALVLLARRALGLG